ncbi:hypothetical protein K493DRAFT_407033 [Basidiobolus meristosporus CBS 931.73]|uniref:Nudix hydrolase domain-containing protein n=1 Tax=Basidiobolus meristosporus CBS 931.73 TaxID=1314790 RepID=A0A1Y1YGF2_9FUNG|nr:hypothetical protein K493DRAFT_407033 [Basidiobolus meristosporus CBS 931.73]|eukprot:ORX97120.1 hypothetical protein K493DRAFT_407033 [Basidiobolus meristosporus CBS 931.73]
MSDRLLNLVENLKNLPGFKISSKPHIRRAAVAIILRVKPSEEEPYQTTGIGLENDLESFLKTDWVRRGTLEILYIQRASRSGDRWSGQIAFPGGKNEKNEEDTETAVRETLEEIDLDLSSPAFTHLGSLDDQKITGRGGHELLMILSAQVYLQLSKVTPEVKLQESEVAEVRWIPVPYLLEHLTTRKRELIHINVATGLSRGAPKWIQDRVRFLFGNFQFPGIRLPQFPSKATLWGITFRTTSELLDMIWDSKGNVMPSLNETPVTFNHFDMNWVFQLLMSAKFQRVRKPWVNKPSELDDKYKMALKWTIYTGLVLRIIFAMGTVSAFRCLLKL